MVFEVKGFCLLSRDGRIAVAFEIFLLAISLVSSQALAQSQPTREVPVDSIIYDLKNPDPVRRKEAAMLLGNKRVQRAIPDLVTAANDSDATVRREIVIALDKMLDVRTVPAFVSLINDPEKDIRERCIYGLINVHLPQESGLAVTLTKMANFFNPRSDEWADVEIEPGMVADSTVIDALQGRLQDSDEGIRVKAARALGILNGRQAISAMLDSLGHDRSNSVRFELVRSLRKIGDPGVAKDLVNYVGYNDSRVRNESVQTLGRLRYRESVPELTRLYEKESALAPKQMDKKYREHLLDALAFIADLSSKELFVKEKQNPDNTLRLHALEGLARIGDPAIVTEISRARLREKDVKIRTAQAFALYRMGRKEYLDEVVNSLSSRRTLNEAKQYLVELRPDELPALYEHVRNNNVTVREALAEIFGLIGGSSAIPALQELSKDQRGEISALANQGMRRINARATSH